MSLERNFYFCSEFPEFFSANCDQSVLIEFADHSFMSWNKFRVLYKPISSMHLLTMQLQSKPNLWPCCFAIFFTSAIFVLSIHGASKAIKSHKKMFTGYVDGF